MSTEHNHYNKMPEWIVQDLNNSGLNHQDLNVIPLSSQQQLQDWLGFTQFDSIKILDVGGYFIPYPGLQSYYRLKLREKIGDAKYLSPKASGNHVFMPPEVKEFATKHNPDKALFITEGEKKAAKATKEGFPTIGLSGVWNFKDRNSDFLPELDNLNFKYRKVYIVFDSDISLKHSVRRAELRLANELVNRGADVYAIRFPHDDVGKNGFDDYLVKYGKRTFQELLEKAKSVFESHIEEDTPIELLIGEIARVKSAVRSEELIKLLAKVKQIPKDTIRKEMSKVLVAEKETKERTEDTFTELELKKAIDILESNDILDKMIDLTESSGYVGEHINKKILFLSFTSRLMDHSISCIVKGSSASGKSSLVHSMLKFFPESDTLKYSYITSKALVHSQNDLSHKILFVQERNGSESADYSIRTTISEGEISIFYPVKNQVTGVYETRQKCVDATGLVFVETTTKDRVHAENETRVFNIYMDESEKQTQRIMSSEAREIDRKVIDSEYRIWRAAQTLLESKPVLIPYADKLIDPFPKEKLRSRRDFKRFLSLIRAHALLHQYKRETDGSGRIIANFEDLKSTVSIANTVLCQSLKEYTPNQEAVLRIINDHFINKEFSISELKEKMPNLSSKTLNRYMKQFDGEFIIWNEEKGKNSRYSSIQSSNLLSPMEDFSSKVLKLFNNYEDTSKCPKMSSKTSNKHLADIEDNKRQRKMSLAPYHNGSEYDGI